MKRKTSQPRLDPTRAQAAREELVRTQRAQVIQAMAEVCAERGYAEATEEAIAERAEVSMETFRGLFPNKEECFVAGLNGMLAEITVLVSKNYSPDKSHCELIRDGAAVLLELMAAQPSFAKIAFFDCPTASARTRSMYDSGVRLLVSLLELGWAFAPEDAVRPLHTGRAALGGAEALIKAEIAAGRIAELPELLPDVLYACLVPFLGQEEALRQAELASEPLE